MKVEIKDLIKIHEFKKKYHVVFNKANYVFYPGVFYYILGEAASGKTSLLNILGLQVRKDEGLIIVNDKKLTKFSSLEKAKIRNKKIGYVYDYPVLNSSLTVRENIMLPLLINDKFEKNQRERMVRDLLIEFGLERKADYFPHHLSETEKHKTCIIRALIHKPDLILLDEPYKNLDLEIIDLLNDKLRKLVLQGHTVILASKYEPASDFEGKILKIENRVLVEENGR